jgi:hypothetical protein
MAQSALRSEVFSLWPFSKKGNSSASLSALDEALRPNKLWDEPVTINGASLTLRLGLLKSSLRENLKILRDMYPKAKISQNPTAALITVKLKSGALKRLYLVQIGGLYPVVQFSMDLPVGGLPKSFLWPSELLLPSGASPVTYMHFPNRNSYYGNFSMPGQASLNLTDLSKTLQTDGWINVTKESGNSLSGNGEVFIRENPPGILLLNCNDKDTGISNTAIYMRPLKSAR